MFLFVFLGFLVCMGGIALAPKHAIWWIAAYALFWVALLFVRTPA